MKLEGDGRGLFRMTILQPVSQQGLVLIDDGRTMRAFSRDEGVVHVIPSTRLTELDPAERIELIRRNYGLRLDMGGRTVAGRRTMVIVATPRRTEMPERTLFLDRVTLFVLRHETSQGGQKLALLDTLSVTFPTRADADVDAPPPGTWRTRRSSHALDARNLDAARRMAGFRPLVPRDLPMGFEISDMQVIDKENGLVAIRLSDGLAMATVYQWLPERNDDDENPIAPDRTGRGGVAVLIVGAIPGPARQRLLDAFAPRRQPPAGQRASRR
jgi:hypothetical protein